MDGIVPQALERVISHVSCVTHALAGSHRPGGDAQCTCEGEVSLRAVGTKRNSPASVQLGGAQEHGVIRCATGAHFQVGRTPGRFPRGFITERVGSGGPFVAGERGWRVVRSVGAITVGDCLLRRLRADSPVDYDRKCDHDEESATRQGVCRGQGSLFHSLSQA